MNQELNLVAAEEVRYTERNLSTDRNHLRDPSDGHMDEVHTIRERVWADVVMLLRHSPRRDDSGGGGFRVYPITAPNAPDYAFGVVTINRAIEGPVAHSATAIFAHELGHIMGLDHDRYTACNSNATNRGCPNIDYPYAFGYVNQEALKAENRAVTSKRWRTIMSYPDQCIDARFLL